MWMFFCSCQQKSFFFSFILIHLFYIVTILQPDWSLLTHSSTLNHHTSKWGCVTTYQLSVFYCTLPIVKKRRKLNKGFFFPLYLHLLLSYISGDHICFVSNIKNFQNKNSVRTFTFENSPTTNLKLSKLFVICLLQQTPKILKNPISIPSKSSLLTLYSPSHSQRCLLLDCLKPYKTSTNGQKS